MYSVLIIEDEKMTAECVRDALELEKIHSDIAIDGIDGLEKFKEGKYDLILLDLKMPKLDGKEVLREIRKFDPFIDVIIYTNFQDFTDIKTLSNYGIDGYMNKGSESSLSTLVSIIKEKLSPIDIDELSRLLNNTYRNIELDTDDK